MWRWAADYTCCHAVLWQHNTGPLQLCLARVGCLLSPACRLHLPQGDPFKTLFVSRLSYDVTERKLKREFEEYGPIKRIRLVHNKNSGALGVQRGTRGGEARDRAPYKQAKAWDCRGNMLTWRWRTFLHTSHSTVAVLVPLCCRQAARLRLHRIRAQERHEAGVQDGRWTQN